MSPPEFLIENSFGYALHHASYILKASMKDRFRTAGVNVTPEEFVFLFLIPEEGASQNLLTKKSLKDKTTITRLVDRLVTKGWISRIENENNRREQIIFVTAEGADVKLKLMPIAQDLISVATQGLDAKDVEISRKTLNQIILNLTS
ncbi:MAG: MarR family winged helix-turn-helix transcriptional regulator [Sneathiella sp.]